MTQAVLVVMVLGAMIAYANGADDVSKGIATLAGSGVTKKILITASRTAVEA